MEETSQARNRTSREEEEIEKFKREWRHFKYLEKQGFTSLEIADKLVHEMFEAMKMGLRTRFPQKSEAEIQQELRKIMELNRKMQEIKRRDRNG